MPKSVIHTVKSVSFSVEGTEYDVSAIDMTLLTNSFPIIKVSIAPESARTAAASGGPKIHKLSLESLNKALKDLIEKAAENKKAKLELSVIGQNAVTKEEEEEQKLSINDWLLIGAGLGNVTTTNTFSIECTIVHPIYELALYGGFFSNIVKRLELVNVSKGASNPLDAGKIVCQEILDKWEEQDTSILDNGATIPPAHKNAIGILGDVKSVFEKVPSMFDDRLEWDSKIGGGSGLPCQEYLGPIEDGLKYAICNTWLSALLHGGSVWDAFMDITSVCGCWMIPDYTKKDNKLPVTPAFPWMQPEIAIKEEDGYVVSFPGADPTPIYGVAGVVESAGGFGSLLSTWINNNSEKTGKDGGMLAFVPESDGKVTGSFAGVTFPGWLAEALYVEAVLADSGFTAYGEKPEEPDTPPSGKNTYVGCVNDAKMAWLSYMYSIFFKRKLEATVGCPLMFTSGGKTILPGYSAKYVSGDKTLFEGTLVSVAHHIDMESGSGTTALHFGWCRPDGGYPITNKYGYKCPIYS